MRKISILLCAFVIALSTATYAETTSVSAISSNHKSISIKGVPTFNVTRIFENDNISIKVTSLDGKEFWSSIPLGLKPWSFKLNDKTSSLEVEDVDGDNIPEIITACTIGDIQSALYIFKYDEKKKSFTPMNFGYTNYKDMTRDFMVSDIPAVGENMIFEGKTTVRCLGKIYTENGPVPGFYYFKLTNGEFMTGEPVPAAKDVTPPPSTKPEVIEEIPPADDGSEKG